MRRLIAPVGAIIALVTTTTPALGLLVWTLTATPSAAQAGVETTFTFTATNLDALTELGCLEVDVPESFTILGAASAHSSVGRVWEAVIFPGNKVAVHATQGGGRLELGHSVQFNIRVVANVAGASIWSSHAHRDQDCTGPEELGAALAITVLPGPNPTPAPTPKPTPRPTPTPTPTPIQPSLPLPSVPVTVSIRPDPTPSPTPRATGSPPPTAQPAATVTPAGGATPTPGVAPSEVPSPTPPPGASGRTASGDLEIVVVAAGEAQQGGGSTGEVTLGPLGVIDGFTTWAIPGAVVGGPGLIVILWVVFQTGVAVAWIPAVRRLRGSNTEPRRASPTVS